MTNWPEWNVVVRPVEPETLEMDISSDIIARRNIAPVSDRDELIRELVEALEATIFAAESSEACLKTWNNGSGGPANVDSILDQARTALSKAKQAGYEK